MTPLAALTIAIAAISTGIGLLRYLHQRGKDKPIFEVYQFHHTDKSVRVKIKIKNKSKDIFEVKSIRARRLFKRLYISKSVLYERRDRFVFIPAPFDNEIQPFQPVPSEENATFDFFIFSDDSIIESSFLIIITTSASLFSMVPMIKIIKLKYIP